jgi:hypothetical protein
MWRIPERMILAVSPITPNAMGSVVTMDRIQGQGCSYKSIFPLIWNPIHRYEEGSSSEQFRKTVTVSHSYHKLRDYMGIKGENSRILGNHEA